ncbi:hypothetical protein [Pelagicoccus sp. SDUM812003]|uniref:hypothetical protein n=1 Tax=Pelagicoccus sp. SDUM812003 TaxID=3041267 RepID=UPI00280FBBF3|nr:hypothetical protein [Pelagicoccus sp. SDUM812003]MDQ8204356.1 hypothetical protein [Pelagicoccus sp. SDUM812003]
MSTSKTGESIRDKERRDSSRREGPSAGKTNAPMKKASGSKGVSGSSYERPVDVMPAEQSESPHAPVKTGKAGERGDFPRKD